MKIIKALYGTLDVTNKVLNFFRNDSLNIYVSNDIFGDPNPGILKNLIITFDNGLEISQKENLYLVYPKTYKEKLGIFYTNNNNPVIYDTIDFSLQTIKRSSEKQADIITCVWNSIPNNPFSEIIARTKTSSHLNQVLQILQLLYTAKLQNYEYKYVSFLEHDCLYPEGYFSYPDFENNCISNMNYIGLSVDGWQTKKFNHKPLSQITMKFDYAVKHFESILPNALVRNAGLLEPPHDENNIGEWMCENPAVHVNHGYHFTSHYTIYSKSKQNNNYYWGDSSIYSHIFPKKS